MNMWNIPKTLIVEAAARKFGVRPIYVSVVSGLWANVQLPNGSWKIIYDLEVR